MLWKLDAKTKKEEQESHYKEFKLLMNDMIKAFIPKIDEERCNSAFSRYRQLVSDEELKTSGVMIAPPKFKYEGVKERLRSNLEIARSNLSAIISSQLYDETELTEDNVDHKIDKLKAIVKKCEENILRIISDFNSELSNTAKILDVPLRDLVKFERLEKISEPRKIKESKTHYRKEKKSGIGGGIERFFGKIFVQEDWGYKEVSYTVEELHKERTAEELKKYIKTVRALYTRTIEGWLSGLRAPIENINSEIDRFYDSFIERQKKIQETEDVLWVISELKKLLSTFDKHTKTINHMNSSSSIKDNEDSLGLSQVSLSGYQMGLLNISRMVLHKVAQQSLMRCLKAVQASQKAIIMGWDIECIQNFAFRFLGLELSAENYAVLEKSGKVLLEDNLFILCPNAMHLKQLQKEHAPYTFYIMVNAQQDGSAKNQISKLMLKDNIRANDRIFFVVQEFDSLIASNGIQEMKSNLQEYYDEFEINGQKGLILINDDNPIYNIAFTQSQLQPCNSITEEQVLLEQLKNRFSFLFDSNVSNTVADLIRNERKEWVAI